MKLVESYRYRAKACRALARKMISPLQRDESMGMAAQWNLLANQRMVAIALSPSNAVH